jgi:hypothetical protein
MIQRSGRLVSEMNANVRDIRPTKMEDCCVMSSAAKPMPSRMPKYLATSPTSILMAIRFIE